MAISSHQISLVIPGLLGPQQQYALLAPQELPVLKHLTPLLSRATLSRYENSDWLKTVFDLLFPDSNVSQLPFAAISAEYDKLTNIDTFYLRIDPVYLRIDMDSALLLAADELQLSHQEVSALIKSINEHLQQDGLQIIAPHPHRWYLQFDAVPDITTTPLHQVMGDDINKYLPEGNDRNWCSLLNEIQMLLHSHPVNEKREQQGLAPVNSVWFWGEGILPEKGQSYWSKIYSNEPMVEILSTFCGVSISALDQYASGMVDGNVLVITTDLQKKVQDQDIFSWVSLLDQLDRSLFNHIFQSFKSKKLQQFTLYPGHQVKFESSLSQFRKWWKRNKPLAYFLQQ